MITCKECKFWDKGTHYPSIDGELDEKYGDCGNDSFKYEGYGMNNRTDMLIYSDYDGYSAGVAVGQDFGCIHGVKK